MSETRELLLSSKAWPIVEAAKLLGRSERQPGKAEVLLETGYGPSGLPHIGTFAEVFRTTLVRQAFAHLSDRASRLLAFSDDMDGLRKVPENIPNADMVERHLHRPLTAIPDPFGTHESYGAHMNARFRAFLDDFGLDYEFVSATECYRSGRFNAVLLKVLERHDAVREVVLPWLGEERRATYSPILPVCPRSGRVLQVPIVECRLDAGSVIYRDPETGHLIEVPVTDGHAKLQWRADWALRWTALGIDYEMYGKDLIDSVKMSSAICRALDGSPPEGFSYELFLDEQGHKISKSIGNGLTVEEWLTYGTRDSLKLFLYHSPRKAKRLYFDVIPRHVDEYFQLLERFRGQDEAERLSNPVWHLHDGDPPDLRLPISYTMLLNLASVVNADSPEVLWSFITRYAPEATPESMPHLDELVGHALAYHRDFVRPSKAYREPDAAERKALEELREVLGRFEEGAPGEAIQFEVYEVGKRHGYADLRQWFRMLYNVLLGQEEGPRFGTFVAFYGVANTRALIDRALRGDPRGAESAA